MLTGDKTPATLEGLKEVIAEAEDDLVTGNAEIAAVQLFKVIESPRYAKFDYAPEYAIAELTLARALIRSGAYKSAERYLLRVLGRGTKSPAFAPAYRAIVDIALETHEQTEILAVLDHFGQDFAARGGVMPRDSEKEHTYLAAKVAYEAGDTLARRGAVLQHRPAVPLLRGGAVLPRPDPGAPGALRVRAPKSLRDRRAGRSERVHLLHRRPLPRHQGSRVPRARTHLARAGEVRRRVLLLFPRPRGFGAPARRAVRGVLVDVPGGRVRGGERVPGGVRPVVRQDAARARRAAAARDDRPQVVPFRRDARHAGQAGQDLRPDAGEGRGAAQESRRSGSRSTAACSASGRSRRRAIRSSSCSRSIRGSSSSTATSSRSIGRPG